MAHQGCIRQARENEALHAIRAARSFVSLWHDIASHAGLDTTNDIRDTLDRLSQAELFHLGDEKMFSTIEQTLVNHLNKIATFADGKGYGDFAIANDTSSDFLFSDRFKKARHLIEAWKAFKHARQQVIDRRHAARIASV